MRDTIDGVLIDPDENGFHLLLSGQEREYNFTLDAQAAAALLTAVKTEIEPWWTEADLIRRLPRILGEESSGRLTDAGYENPRYYDKPGRAYESDNPKSEGYHDRMSEVWDNREKT